MMRNEFRLVTHCVTKPELVSFFKNFNINSTFLLDSGKTFRAVAQQVAANWRSNSDLTSKFLLLCEIKHDGACQRLARLKRSVGIVVELNFARSHHFALEIFEIHTPATTRSTTACREFRTKSDDSALDGYAAASHLPAGV